MTEVSMGRRIMAGRPPDKGSFPLDHFGECTALKEEYMRCLRDNSFDNMSCRYLSKQYLECRMDKNLMRHEPMSSLGFTDSDEAHKAPRKRGKEKTKESTGWVVGVDGIQPDRQSNWRRPTLINVARLFGGGEDHTPPKSA
uniref:CHCH domain-containing protein n=1 Tax=Zooxanthella nutricula TaxID=1333877 RepID=A0A7S2MZ10_9DINO